MENTLCRQRSSSLVELRASQQTPFTSPVDYMRASVYSMEEDADQEQGGDWAEDADDYVNIDYDRVERVGD